MLITICPKFGFQQTAASRNGTARMKHGVVTKLFSKQKDKNSGQELLVVVVGNIGDRLI